MPLNIRNDRALELARSLAERDGTSITEAVIKSLEQSLEARNKKRPLAERLKEISRNLKDQAGPNPQVVTKEDIDAFWGQ